MSKTELFLKDRDGGIWGFFWPEESDGVRCHGIDGDGRCWGSGYTEGDYLNRSDNPIRNKETQLAMCQRCFGENYYHFQFIFYVEHKHPRLFIEDRNKRADHCDWIEYHDDYDDEYGSEDGPQGDSVFRCEETGEEICWTCVGLVEMDY